MITAEISLYPLRDEFEETVISFIKKLKKSKSVEVYTHSMSTFVRGESKEVFDCVRQAFDKVSPENDTLSLVIKIINRPLYPEKTNLDY